MKILILGSTGMLGHCLYDNLLQQGYDVSGVPRHKLDFTKESSIYDFFEHQGDCEWVINAAAYTQVDAAEEEKELCQQVNANGPKVLATVCAEKKIKLIHFSTDYVFDGEKSTPYVEEDETNPLNHYGYTKLAAEQAIESQDCQSYIFRLQWIYGQHGHHFIRTMHRLMQEKERVRIVSDQWGAPTWVGHIAKAVLAFIKNQPDFGLYHIANTGYTTWYDFACHFQPRLTTSCRIYPCTTPEFPRPATRPLQSRLSIEKFHQLGLYTFPHWEEAIDESWSTLL